MESAKDIRVTPIVFRILVALSDGDLHGYAIMQSMRRFGDGSYKVGPGALYRAIKQMLATGLIIEIESPVPPETDDERRRYYHLTDLGRDVAGAETLRLRALVDAVEARSQSRRPTGRVAPAGAGK
jgi:DNA-binding PadR family transcriptional regulator